MRKPRRPVAAAAVALVAAGCGPFLFPMGGPGEFGEPEPVATYESGTATLEFEDGRVIDLDGLWEGPHLFTQMGGSVNWFNEDGWGLRVTLYPQDPTGEDFDAAFATLDWIRDGVHWSTFEGGACSLDVAVADETGLRGDGRCIDLEWVDTLRGGEPFARQPEPVEGEEPFDVAIRFEASP